MLACVSQSLFLFEKSDPEDPHCLLAPHPVPCLATTHILCTEGVMLGHVLPGPVPYVSTEWKRRVGLVGRWILLALIATRL